MAERRHHVILVTGASSGLGNACATYLAKKGYIVYGTSRTPETKHRRADEFFELIRMDVTNDDSVASGVSYVLAKEGHIDTLICSHGFGIAGPVEETPIPDAIRQMDANFMGVARIVHEVVAAMRASGGTILVVGSLAGRTGLPFNAYYSASKFALEGFVESMRLELHGFPVRLALIEPGDFRTGFITARQTIGLADTSPYAATGRCAMSVIEDGERAGADPVLFSRLILRLVRKDRLRARYTVGLWFNRFAITLKWFLPHSLFEFIFMAYFRCNSRNGVRDV
ncbi:MAG TPA: SDR family NAD(P)-dependent oxidoreductase [bacterium]|nr:SDR family NAD(P)-dependent oxidoreductase [bacterium]